MSGAGTPDFFYREAQRLGYVARSAFKLLQIQKQHRLITQGSSVLDLGCAPGAWLQVACQSLGPLKNGGTVVGIDLKKVKVPPLYCDARVRTVCADVMKLPKNQVRALSPRHKGFSVVLSDMCPLVSGITTRDAALSAELGMQALDLAVGRAATTHLDEDIRTDRQLNDSVCAADDNGILQPGGHLVIKLLESEDNKEFSRICKPLFRKASWLRPKATRVFIERDLFDLSRSTVLGTLFFVRRFLLYLLMCHEPCTLNKNFQVCWFGSFPASSFLLLSLM